MASQGQTDESHEAVRFSMNPPTVIQLSSLRSERMSAQISSAREKSDPSGGQGGVTRNTIRFGRALTDRSLAVCTVTRH